MVNEGYHQNCGNYDNGNTASVHEGFLGSRNLLYTCFERNKGHCYHWFESKSIRVSIWNINNKARAADKGAWMIVAFISGLFFSLFLVTVCLQVYSRKIQNSLIHKYWKLIRPCEGTTKEFFEWSHGRILSSLQLLHWKSFTHADESLKIFLFSYTFPWHIWVNRSTSICNQMNAVFVFNSKYLIVSFTVDSSHLNIKQRCE